MKLDTLSRLAFSAVFLVGALGLPTIGQAQPTQPATLATIDPLQLQFHRMAVRRFVFNNNLPLASFDPRETVDLPTMHPIVNPANADYAIADGTLQIKGTTGGESSLYVSGLTPYAVYDLDLRSLPTQAGEVGMEFATNDQNRRVQVIVKTGATTNAIVLRLMKDGHVVRETPLYTGATPQIPATLRVQLTGISVGLYLETNGQTKFLGYTPSDKERFGDVIDFRNRQVTANCQFNIVTRLPQGATAVLGGARSFLSVGIGQADIRMVTHKDGSPYWEDNRLWFTFSARGPGNDSTQGVMSLNPNAFDVRFEGTLVYDRGDGLLRNDFATHLFYDDDAKEWHSFACGFSIFGGGNDRGSSSGMLVATSRHNPLHGFSVMKARPFTAIPGAHEDPCVFYDAEAKKWRLLTTSLAGFKALMFEADNWDGPYTKIAGPVDHDSTGTLIQKIGTKRYVFSGSADKAIYIYSYPDLKPLGQLKMDMPPWTATGNGRVWPNVFPLPAGYPARYMALMMDRANFPDIKGPNWTYGALYLYYAYTPNLSDEAYEFATP